MRHIGAHHACQRPPFASVKLPASLVQQAREAALPQRRSVAGQIEYWAKLGRIADADTSGRLAQAVRDTVLANRQRAQALASKAA